MMSSIERRKEKSRVGQELDYTFQEVSREILRLKIKCFEGGEEPR